MPAPDIDDPGEGREVVAPHDRPLDHPGDPGHRVVEDPRRLRVPREVLPAGRAEDVVEGDPARPDAVHQVAPCRVMLAAEFRGHEGAERPRLIRPQCRPDGGRREPPPVVLGEDSDPGERPQDAVEGRLVRARQRREFGGGPGLIGEVVGETEIGGDVQRPRGPEPGDDLEHLVRRRGGSLFHGAGSYGWEGGVVTVNIIRSEPRRNLSHRRTTLPQRLRRFADFSATRTGDLSRREGVVQPARLEPSPMTTAPQRRVSSSWDGKERSASRAVL